MRSCISYNYLVAFIHSSSSWRSGHERPFFFFFNDTATTEIYTLSLHDALPIFVGNRACPYLDAQRPILCVILDGVAQDRKSTRLNSSHLGISYAVFCLKKKTTGPRIEICFQILWRPTQSGAVRADLTCHWW